MRNNATGRITGIILILLSLSFADGLPGEYLLSTRWRQIFPFQTPLNNPAFMMEEAYSTLRAAFSISPFGVANLWEVGTVIPVDLYNTVGLSLIGENGGKLNNYSFRGNELIKDGTSRTGNFLLMCSYAINPWRKVSIGANMNMVYENNFGDPTWGVGFDLGVSYRLLYHPKWGYHCLGVNWKNMVAPGLNWDRMPYAAKLQTHYHFVTAKNKVEFDYLIGFSDFTSSSSYFNSGNRKIDWDMAFQVGIVPLPYLKVKAFGGFDEWKRFNNAGMALGFNIPHREREFSAFYQYGNNLSSDFVGSHSVYLTAQLGPNREELFAFGLRNVADVSASDLYNRSMEMYSEGKYWDAYFTLNLLMQQHPDFFKTNALQYFAASSLENLDMRRAAITAYNDTKNQYPQNPFLPEIELGLVRLYYRSKEYEKMEKKYSEIISCNLPDSVKQYAAYYMGEAELDRGNYQRAYDHLNSVKSGHAAYVFAQHSLATVQEFIDGDKSRIIQFLKNVIDAPNVVTKAQKEIVNRSLVLLGYHYYEQNAMAKAVLALRMVEKGSFYYEDALLGLGWSAIKSKQWEDCIIAGEKLYPYTNKTTVKCEALMIQAYGYVMKKQYGTAEMHLLEALNKIHNYFPVTQKKLDSLDLVYNINRNDYEFLSLRVVTVAKGADIDSKWKLVETLHQNQKNLKQNIDNLVGTFDVQNRIRFFESSVEKLKEDLEYALITVQRIQTEKYSKEEEMEKKNRDAISNEIDRLQKQMETAE